MCSNQVFWVLTPTYQNLPLENTLKLSNPPLQFLPTGDRTDCNIDVLSYALQQKRDQLDNSAIIGFGPSIQS